MPQLKPSPSCDLGLDLVSFIFCFDIGVVEGFMVYYFKHLSSESRSGFGLTAGYGEGHRTPEETEYPKGEEMY